MPVKIVERRHFNTGDGLVSVPAGAAAGSGAALGPAVAAGVRPTLAAGTGAALDPAVTVSSGVLYGFNVNSGNAGFGSETPTQSHARLLSSYNLSVLPIAKMFYSGSLPTTWSSTFSGVVSGRRLVLCYKPKTTVANGAAGDMDAEVASFAASVPRDWYVAFVFFQEPDDNIKAGGFTASAYRAVYARHYPLIRAAQKAPSGGLRGNRLEMWSCFQTPFAVSNTAAQSAAWLPDPTFDDGADGGCCDGYGWDCYGNPQGVGGTRYDSLYDPSFATRFQYCLDANAIRGVTRYGVMETGAPWRNWDTGAVARGAYMEAGFDWLNTRPTRPEFIIPWNALGNWDHRIVADGLPTQYDHGSDVPRFVNVPATPDEPYQVLMESRIKGGIYTQYVGPA